MTSQLDFFADRDGDALAVPELPEGFRYRRELISPAEEDALIARLSSLPFREFEFHGYTGKRRVVSYGWRYDFSQRELRKAEDLPYFLLPLREAAAAFSGLDPQSLEQVLVSEYRPGAGIGWHRDKDVFGQTVGVSLHSPCMFRLRRAAGGKWQRAKLMAEPRSAYLLSGSVRSDWEHSIPAVDTLRYSVTFRNLRA